jgi:Dolichyl-phosphate-mannose-protein mannosyltransferase
VAPPAAAGGENSAVKRAWVFVALVLLTVLGGTLRFRATSFGLPDRFRPDEQWVVPHALDFQENWNPGFAIYPAAQMYVQHAVLRVYARFAAPSGEEWRQFYSRDAGSLALLLARRASAAMGTATIPAVYLATSSAFGAGAGLVAAAIVAVCPVHVRDSKFATTDAGMVFWLTLSLWMVVRIVRRGGLADYAAAGLLGGLATATKYPAAAVLAAIGAAHLGARRREGRSLTRAWRDLRVVAAFYAFVAAFALSTPYFFLAWHQTRTAFEYQRGPFLNSVNEFQDGSGWYWLLGHAMPDGFGVQVEVLFLLAGVWAVLRRRRAALSLLAFVAVAALAVTRSASVYYRYILPLLPALAMLAAGLAADVAAGVRWPKSRLGRGMLAAIALGILLVPSIVLDLQMNALLGRDDTRTLARRWIVESLPAGSLIAATDLSNPTGKPQLPESHRYVAFEGVAKARSDGIEYVLADSLPQLAYFSRGPRESDLDQLEREATLVFDADPVDPGSPPAIFDRADGFYAPLRRIPGATRPGPRIRIWRLDGTQPAVRAKSG